MSNIKYFGYKIRIQFSKNCFSLKKNYSTKKLSAYIVYDLDHYPRNPLGKFLLKNSLHGASNIVANNSKKSICIVAKKNQLMEQLHGVLVMISLQMP